ncbi:MAG: GDP-mannose 4,6-dehydratase [Bdellovibrionales bacterium]|nr:GDP-mannose 4,6-dehydratase [Bdellovibrionales bacterium]
MRCIVTGAAGFIGSSLSDALLADGHEVVGIDCFVDYYPREMKERNLEQARAHERFTFVEQNLLNADLDNLLEGADWIFHQAAQAGVRASWGGSFSIYTDNNVLATQMLLEAAKREPASKTLKKFVYASSSSVYGSAEVLPTTESVLPCPVSPYGVSKLAAEHLASLYDKEFNVPTMSLRYFTVFGPRQRPDMAFHRFIKAGLNGEPITVYGDGEQSRDFTFIADIVKANMRAAEVDARGEVLNIGGGSRVTLNETISVIEDVLGRKLNIDRQNRQYGDARHTGADTSRAKQVLDFAPNYPLKDGLAAEARWLEAVGSSAAPRK